MSTIYKFSNSVFPFLVHQIDRSESLDTPKRGQNRSGITTYTAKGDRRTSQATHLNDIGSELLPGSLGEHACFDNICKTKEYREHDGQEPDYDSDNLEAAELVMEVVENDCQDAGALRYQENLRGTLFNQFQEDR
jgi:hypothetical protein